MKDNSEGLAGRPIFTTGIAAKIVGLKPKTIINYEARGLIEAARTPKNRRLFSKDDLRMIMLINYLTKEKNLTFNGVKFFLDLNKKIADDGVNLLECALPESVSQEIERKIDI